MNLGVGHTGPGENRDHDVHHHEVHAVPSVVSTDDDLDERPQKVSRVRPEDLQERQGLESKAGETLAALA